MNRANEEEAEAAEEEEAGEKWMSCSLNAPQCATCTEEQHIEFRPHLMSGH